ncbi:hypothetical protein EHEL_100610 [Encephalitozoon hellem ATCC 50504]|uniref:Pre-mRNA-splicing factor 38 n=1 Tax=Encephalitozoon hellem TaxID=27973 RepID=A0A9Q9FCE2_ENCHE|nr:uncharacterized protein EHEL_100610 [Encephalitozoon hellem ATCC 50504]AFM99154.1 hypothetical protein EHEL_100610 [Encephalitozoon hellem ATCC 50504]UTX44140.1 pre-mRNA-splicing factor 38 [Encephalitozoon hellem]WEL39629.1 pre-mRNA-splicing factor 38 [Encephalitozoon hellem]|eukprot:XP_003888135.1 hypothetical protein EHEL_100610 [Encephalitozoon hellem ATCC 50504]
MQYKGINRMTREKILSSEEFKSMRSFTESDVVESICTLDSIGGLVRGVPHRFLCLVQKMGAISMKEEAIAISLENLRPTEPRIEDSSMKKFRGNVCLIAASLLYLRLSKRFDDYRSLTKSFLMDFRKIPVIDSQNNRTFMYLDVLADDLLNKNRIFNVHLGGANRTS